MAKWTISVTIYNALDRTLKLESMEVPYGRESSRATTIAPKTSGTFSCYTPPGEALGPEVYFTLRDIPNTSDKTSYGTVGVHVDVPYWSHTNTLSVNPSGILAVSGDLKLPDGQHDYVGTITVSKK